jgi:hypothetical protein
MYQTKIYNNVVQFANGKRLTCISTESTIVTSGISKNHYHYIKKTNKIILLCTLFHSFLENLLLWTFYITGAIYYVSNLLYTIHVSSQLSI